MARDTQDIDQPVVIPVEAYISRDYVAKEAKSLWPRTWQVACRLEEIPSVGDYVSYDIGSESIIVTRVSPSELRAYYNVCLHRGRRLVDGAGHAPGFYCRYHGWKWDLTGENIHVESPQDWQGRLCSENLRMKQVRVGSWGGFVFVNQDPDAEPLEDFLAPVAARLGPFELDRMRYRWRQRTVLASNWKTVLEAFMESYHVIATHPQLTKRASFDSWCKVDGRHSWHGYNMRAGGTSVGLKGEDPRVGAALWFRELYTTINATTTETFVQAAERAVDELPADASGDEVMGFVMQAAQRDYEAKGVVWPEITPEQFVDAGVDWHIFPNLVILPGLAQALCYRARPNGDDPDSCIFEVFVIEFFPPDGEPKTEWVDVPDLGKQSWPLILTQDFSNIPEVQKGMKSAGFAGPRPSPIQEQAVIAFHRNLSDFVGDGAPVPMPAAD